MYLLGFIFSDTAFLLGEADGKINLAWNIPLMIKANPMNLVVNAKRKKIVEYIFSLPS